MLVVIPTFRIRQFRLLSLLVSSCCISCEVLYLSMRSYRFTPLSPVLEGAHPAFSISSSHTMSLIPVTALQLGCIEWCQFAPACGTRRPLVGCSTGHCFPPKGVDTPLGGCL